MKRDKIIFVVLVLALTGWRISRYIEKINASPEPAAMEIALNRQESKTIELSTDKKNISQLNLKLREEWMAMDSCTSVGTIPRFTNHN